MASTAHSRPRLVERVRPLLERPGAHRPILVASVLLAGASIDTGLGADDHIQRLILSGSDAIEGFRRAPFDLFRFAHPNDNAALMDAGVFPWWTDPKVELAFFRPLTSFTHWVDFRLWPDAPALAHLHSLGWFALGLAGIWALYRRLMRPHWLAVLALALYALDDARGAPVAWLANRNAVIACSLTVWVLVFHHRARSEGWKLGTPLALAALAAALAASEGAIGIGAYLFAHAAFLDTGKWHRRFARLLPYLGVVVAWRLLALALEYRVVGSGVYVDPLRQPAAFLGMVAERLPILITAQIAAPWAEIWNGLQFVDPLTEYALMLIAVGVMAFNAVLVAPLWQRDPVFRFWVLGAVLAAIPPCATFPADRLLSWVAIGAMPAVAHVFSALVYERHPGAPLWRPRLTGWLALGTLGLHLVVAPLLLPLRARGIVAVRETLDLGNDSIPKSPDIANKTVIYVNPPGDPFPGFLPFIRADRGEVVPGTQRWLATGITEVTVERLDSRTLRIRPDRGFLVSPSERLLRSRPFAQGDEVALRGMMVRITEVSRDGRPAEAVIQFERPLEDDRHVWFEWRGRGFVPFRLPRIGETVTLPKVDVFELAYG